MAPQDSGSHIKSCPQPFPQGHRSITCNIFGFKMCHCTIEKVVFPMGRMFYLCTSLFCQTWNCFSGLPKLRHQITKIMYLACVHSTSAAQWNSLKLWFHNILWEIILKSCSAYVLSTKFISYHGDKETLATLHKKCCSAYAFWGKGTTYQNLQPHRQDMAGL